MSSKLILCLYTWADIFLCKTHVQTERETNSIDIWKKIWKYGDTGFQSNNVHILVVLHIFNAGIGGWECVLNRHCLMLMMPAPQYRNDWDCDVEVSSGPQHRILDPVWRHFVGPSPNLQLFILMSHFTPSPTSLGVTAESLIILELYRHMKNHLAMKYWLAAGGTKMARNNPALVDHVKWMYKKIIWMF